MASFKQQRSYSAPRRPALFPRVWPGVEIADLSAVTHVDVPHLAAVPVAFDDLHADFLSQYRVSECLAGDVAEGLLRLRRIDSMQTYKSLRTGGVEDREGVAVMDAHNPTRERRRGRGDGLRDQAEKGDAEHRHNVIGTPSEAR